jgi:hypothetical protein
MKLFVKLPFVVDVVAAPPLVCVRGVSSCAIGGGRSRSADMIELWLWDWEELRQIEAVIACYVFTEQIISGRCLYQKSESGNCFDRVLFAGWKLPCAFDDVAMASHIHSLKQA